jgi:hypothetical protein
MPLPAPLPRQTGPAAPVIPADRLGVGAAPLLASAWYGGRRAGLARLRRLTRGGRR